MLLHVREESEQRCQPQQDGRRRLDRQLESDPGIVSYRQGWQQQDRQQNLEEQPESDPGAADSRQVYKQHGLECQALESEIKGTLPIFWRLSKAS